MSVRLYDDAFIEKLQKWTKDTSVSILNPNDTSRLFEMEADVLNDSPIQLPIISLKRPGGFTLLQTNKRYGTYNGLKLGASSSRANVLNAIPISIPYQLDVYTRYKDEADEYVRNLVFNIINYPKLQVVIPYNDENYIHDANIRLAGEIDDNSEIPERLISGQFTRMTMAINIDDAYLWDVAYKDVKKLCLDHEIVRLEES